MNAYYLLGFRDVDGAVVVDLWTIHAHPKSLLPVAKLFGRRADAQYILISEVCPAPEALRGALDAGPAALFALPGVLGLLDVTTGRLVERRDIPQPSATEWN